MGKQATNVDGLARWAIAPLLAIAFVWLEQVRRPPLAAPAEGLLLVSLLAGILFLLVLPASRIQRLPTSSSARTAALTGLLLIVYSCGRWLVDFMPAVGATNAGNFVMAGAYAVATYGALAVYYAFAKPMPGNSSRPFHLLTMILCAGAIICGIHALIQYFYLYDKYAADLRQQIGSGEPTLLQSAMLHHLTLKRVASFWGDPNSFGAFMALSLPFSFALARNGKAGTPSFSIMILGIAGIAGALVGVVISGSRGAILDVLLAALLIVVITRSSRKSTRAAVVGSAILLFTAVTTAPRATSSLETVAQPPLISTEVVKEQSFLRRTATITERLHYAQVGWQIIKRRPVFGAGHGGVDLYYGRYKPVEAREARYLHNWVLQVSAELGLVGLLLTAGFITLVVVHGFRFRTPKSVPFLCAFIVFWADALIQHSFNQRELLCLVGILSAVLLSVRSEDSLSKSVRPRALIIVLMGLSVSLLLFVAPWLYSASKKELAEGYLAEGNTERARHHLRSAQRLTSTDPEIYMLLAQCEEKDGVLHSAVLWMKKALDAQPESAALHANLGQMEMRTGRLEEAEKLFRQAIEIYPTNAGYHRDLANLLEKSGRMDEAVEEARHAEQLAYNDKEDYTLFRTELEKRRGQERTSP